MQAIFNGTVLAESDDIVMVDGNPYFPREAMNTEFFRDSRLTTVCGWKGTARYWDLVVGSSEGMVAAKRKRMTSPGGVALACVRCENG